MNIFIIALEKISNLIFHYLKGLKKSLRDGRNMYTVLLE